MTPGGPIGGTPPGAGGLNIVKKIQEILIADGGVLAKVPAYNIKAGFVGQNLTGNYISHFPIVETEIRMHEGRAALQEWRYQVSCFAPDDPSASTPRAMGEAFEISEAVKDALGGYNSGGIIVTRCERGPYLYDDESQVHHFPVDLTVADRLDITQTQN